MSRCGYFHFNELYSLAETIKKALARAIKKTKEIIKRARVTINQISLLFFYIFSGTETPIKSRVFLSTILVAKAKQSRAFFKFSSSINTWQSR